MASQTSRIYELQVRLAADSLAQLKKLQTESAKTSKSVGFLESTVKGLGAGLAAGLTVDAFVQGLSNAVQHVDELATSAERLGVSIEDFSALAYAAEQSDVSIGTLEQGMKKLSVAMEDSGGKAAKVMAALNVDTGGSVEDTLLGVADAMDKIQDPAQKTATLMAIFGKSGADLAPLMNQGADGIRELTKAADEMGATVSGEQKQALGDLDNLMNDLRASTDAMFRGIATGLAPTLMELGSIFITTAGDADKMKTTGEALGTVLRGLAISGKTVGEAFKGVGTAVGGTAAAIAAAASGDMEAAKNIIAEMTKDAEAGGAAYIDTITDIANADVAAAAPKKTLTVTTEEQAATSARLAGILDTSLTPALKAQAEAEADVAAANEKYVATLRAQVLELQQTEMLMSDYDKMMAAVEAGTLKLTAAQLAEAEALQLTKEAYADSAVAQAEQQKLIDAGVAQTDKMRTNWEVLQDELATYNEMLAAFTIDQETYNRSVRDAADSYVTAEEAAKKSGDTLTSMDTVLEGLSSKIDGYGKEMAGSLVDFAIGADDASMSFSDFATSVLTDITKMIMQMLVMEPLMASIKTAIGGAAGGGGGGGLAATIASMFASADGNVFHDGAPVAFAKGGVVTRPTVFPMANGGIGLMGEAGDEAIMPLQRDSKGRLGVGGSSTGGSNVVVNVYNETGGTTETEETEGPNGEQIINVMVLKTVEDGFARGRFDSILSSSYGVTRRGR